LAQLANVRIRPSFWAAAKLYSKGVCGVIVVVEQHNAELHSDLLDKTFRLRARIFHDQLGWDVKVIDGRERDKYDDEGPVYIIYTDDHLRHVKGSLRLLPTTGPTLLADLFSDTLPDALNLRAPTIWECTRFCLDDETLEKDQEGLLFASSVLMVALGDLAIRTGIESIIGNFDSSMLRLYRRLGCEVEILGSTSRYGQPIYLGLHPISETIVRRIKKKLKGAQLAFAEARVVAA
jgi:acyl homoserine lactone synthase